LGVGMLAWEAPLSIPSQLCDLGTCQVEKLIEYTLPQVAGKLGNCATFSDWGGGCLLSQR
jgi:hypothetical protein